jgi:hypothetical protein
VSWDSIYVNYLEEKNPQEQKTDWWFPEEGLGAAKQV